MKYLFLTLALIFTACSDDSDGQDGNCKEVEYNDQFEIKPDFCYLFDDGVELRISALNNEFCPCDVICVWEGQLKIDMEWIFGGDEILTYTYNAGGGVMSNDTLPNNLQIIHDNEDIEFEVPCDEENPSPKILSTKIIISN